MMQTHDIQAAAGARPAGVADAAAAAQNIRQMFDTIAPTYDRANHLLSFGIDQYWWRRAAWTLRKTLRRADAVVLDLCCGTGDMTLALNRYRPRASAAGGGSAPIAPILAADFSHKMLALGQKKFAGHNIVSVEADALSLPLPNGSVDLVTAAFGFRNLTDYPAGLREIARVLKPGAEVAILECNQPDGVIGALYLLYFRHILPILGGSCRVLPRPMPIFRTPSCDFRVRRA